MWSVIGVNLLALPSFPKVTFPDDELESDLLHFGIFLLHLAHSLGWKMWRRKSAHVMASFPHLLKKQVKIKNLLEHFLGQHCGLIILEY